jgi:tetratricopeptide (TPR) repeat protein
VYAVFNCPSQSIAHGFAGLLFAGMLLARHRASAPARKSRSAAWVQPLGTLAASAFLVWAVVLPSYSLRAAEDAQLAGRPALPLYESVVRHAWPNAAAHRDYGIALADAGRYDEADRELQRALDGLDTGDIYLALAVAASKRGDKQSAYRWAVECTRRWPLNPEARQLIDLERMKDKRLRQNKCIK